MLSDGAARRSNAQLDTVSDVASIILNSKTAARLFTGFNSSFKIWPLNTRPKTKMFALKIHGAQWSFHCHLALRKTQPHLEIWGNDKVYRIAEIALRYLEFNAEISASLASIRKHQSLCYYFATDMCSLLAPLSTKNCLKWVRHRKRLTCCAKCRRETEAECPRMAAFVISQMEAEDSSQPEIWQDCWIFLNKVRNIII